MNKLKKRKEESVKRARLAHKKKRSEEQAGRYESIPEVVLIASHDIDVCIYTYTCVLTCMQESLDEKARNFTYIWPGG